MKKTSGVLLGTFFFCSQAIGQSLTLENVARVQAIVDQVYAAHGGELGLDNLETLVVEQSQSSYAIEQSRAAEPPWDRGRAQGVNAVDVTNRRFANRLVQEGGGFESHGSTIVDAANSVQIDYRAGTITPITNPDFDAASAAFVRVTPPLLVKSLKSRAANAYYLGETSIAGVDYDVLGFSMPVGPAITLYFDKEDHLLRRSERIFAGAGMVEYEFEDYELVNGIPINRTFHLALEGDPNLERSIDAVYVNGSVDEYFEIRSDLKRVATPQADDMSRQEVADGVWLIGGNGTYAMFVDMGEYVFAAGATEGAGDRIRLLREVVGGKPIRYALATHHHFDHLMGIADYQRVGAELIASRYHAEVVRGAAEEDGDLDLLVVDDSHSIESGGRRIEIIDLGPTAHTEHLLAAYLPREKILFEGDHFALPANGSVPPAVSSMRSFAGAIAEHELEIDFFLSAHSSRIGRPEDLEAALNKAIYRYER